MKKRLFTKMTGTVCLLLTIALVALTACNSSENGVRHTETQITSAEPTAIYGELTIATLSFMGTDPFLENAAQRFEALNENVTVNISLYDNWQTYAQIINTALMSGGGEDIIGISTLQWQRLADAGRLLDLNNKLVFAPGEFYQNVLDTFLYNGGRYVVPLAFSMGAFHATEALAPELKPQVLTLENLVAVSNAHQGQGQETLLFLTGSGLGGTPLSIAEMFFELEFHNFVDLAGRTANVDNESFIALLEAVYSIADNIRWAQPGEEALFMEEFIHSPAMALNGVFDYSNLILAANTDGGSLVNATQGFVINANSQNPALAAAFLQFLLSEEIQSSPELFQTPVNMAAAVTRSHATLESVRAYSQYTGFTAGFDLDNNITIFNQLASRATTIGITDSMIRDFVRAEMERFFNGEVTAQQAASNLQIRLTTYLNE